MSGHVAVGSRSPGCNAGRHSVPNHVTPGGGHYVDHGGVMVQQNHLAQPSVHVAYQSALPNQNPTQIGFDKWQWDRLNSKYETMTFMANSDHESSAAQRYLENYIEHPSTQAGFEVVRDSTLMIGSVMAGDVPSAVGYGAAAVEGFVNKTLKDMGFNGGWGDWGQHPEYGPGHGTCPPGPDRD